MRARGHRAGRSSVVLFWSERVRIQPISRGKLFFFCLFFFFLAKINFFLKEELGKQGFFRLNL